MEKQLREPLILLVTTMGTSGVGVTYMTLTYGPRGGYILLGGYTSRDSTILDSVPHVRGIPDPCSPFFTQNQNGRG